MVRDLDALLIHASVATGLNAQSVPGLGLSSGGVVDERVETLKRNSGPVFGDFAEHPVLDRVPFAGTGRVVGDCDGKTTAVSKLLLQELAYRKIKIAASAESCTPDGLEAVFRSLLAGISDGCSNNSTKNMLSTPGWIVKIFPV